MSTHHRALRRTAAAAIAVVAISALGTVAAAASGGGHEVERRGSCSMSADWKLEAKADDGRIEVEAEVESHQSGQTWTWRILHNGGVSAHGTSTTKPPSGSFEVERLLVNAPGPDQIGWRATNAKSGETCSGGLTF